MSLQAVRFKTPNDIELFINRLKQLGCITIANKEGKSFVSCVEQFNNLFIVATNGDTYFVPDLQTFIRKTPKDKLALSSVRFTLGENKVVSLAEIKVNESLIKQVKVTSGFASFLMALNLSYFPLNVPASIETISDVQHIAAVFDNKSLSDLLLYNTKLMLLKKNFLSFVKVQRKESEAIILPLPLPLADIFKRMDMDLLKSNLIQEEQLKKYLLAQLKQLKNKDACDELQRLIAKIDDNREKTIKFLQLFSGFLKKQNALIEAANIKYRQITRDDPDLEDCTQLLSELSTQKEKQSRILNRKTSLFNILRPLTVWGGLIGLPISVLIGIVATMAFWAPVHLIPFLVVIGVATAVLMTVFFNKLKNALDSFFSVYEEQKHLKNTTDHITDLENELQFAQEYSSIKASLVTCFYDYSIMICDLESELNTCTLDEQGVDNTILTKTSMMSGTPKLNNFSIFNQHAMVDKTIEPEEFLIPMHC